MNVKIGISFDGFSTFSETLEIAKQSEIFGMKSLWMAQHMGYREAIVTSTSFLMATKKIKVVPTAISPYLWHPTPTAMSLATMAEATPGRVGVAIGVGNPLFLQESGVKLLKPLRVVREYIEVLQALWSGDQVYHDGFLYKIEGARMAFKPQKPIQIYIAAIKDGMLSLSGRLSDGVVLSAGLSSAFVRRSLDIVDQSLTKYDREQKKFTRAGFLFFASSKNGKEAIDVLRSKLAFTLRNRFLDDNINFSGIPINQGKIIDAVARRNLDEAQKLVPDEAVEAFTIGGTPSQCRDQLNKFIEAGLNEVVLMMVGTKRQKAFSLSVAREFIDSGI